MTASSKDPFNACRELDTPLGKRQIASLEALESESSGLASMPYSIRILLESCLRHCGGGVVTPDDVRKLMAYDARRVVDEEIPFNPGRVVLQDFTGVPAMVDLAAMRSAIVEMTGDSSAAAKVNPLVACDLVIDHSVQVDAFNSGMALSINAEKEFERNQERYTFLKWGQSAFNNFRVVPPATGIVHQVNLEYLAKVCWDDGTWLYPDSLVGTDSHTTMINGLGVLGWGVGGIEAEACMLGQPIFMLLPEVVGFKMTGELAQGCTATDLVLRVTELLREHGVVGKFVEFFGPGLASMPLANRATIANMAPEYGATMGYFPVDERTIDYMRLSGRDEALIETVEQYYRAQKLWHDPARAIDYTAVVELDLAEVSPALAGPRRPQDRIELRDMQQQWNTDLSGTFGRGDEGGTAIATAPAKVTNDGQTFELHDGSVVIAAITSCTNTSNPDVMVGAGLVARKAASLGLTRKPWVKTSLAPGSKVVTEYLERAGLLPDLEAAGFYVVGYGCTTCIGNSGPLDAEVEKAILENNLVAASVLSGNRNFEARVHQNVRGNFLMSPPLVVAFALVGRVNIDLTNEPLGQAEDGSDVFLHDLWPSLGEVRDLMQSSLKPEVFRELYSNFTDQNPKWNEIPSSVGHAYEWDEASTYIQEPPFFEDFGMEAGAITEITGARPLGVFGDSVTTDHISPAGAIKQDSPAGRYLVDNSVDFKDFNSYGSRRGNDRVMTRGTFANVRIKNLMVPGTEGGVTRHQPSGEQMDIYDAAIRYREEGTPLVVVGGKEYGTGSSRDWAAKGTRLLGVRAVVCESFERIHRSNLIGMGVLPLQFKEGDGVESLGLDGSETYDVVGLNDELKAQQELTLRITRADGSTSELVVLCRVDTDIEVEYYRHGGILTYVLRQLAAKG